MSEVKFTPGPWKVFCKTGVLEVQHGEKIPVVFWTGFDDAPQKQKEKIANAFLIAAAPILYKELRHLVNLLEPQEANGGLNVPGLATLNGARAALAKAEGRAK